MICKKSFAQKNVLNSHVQTVRQYEKSFNCLICNKSYGYKGNLNRHVKSTYENICKQSFVDKN